MMESLKAAMVILATLKWYIISGFICVTVGLLAGLFLAALLGSCAKAEEKRDEIETWYDGYEAGKRVKQGQELMEMSRKVMRG